MSTIFLYTRELRAAEKRLRCIFETLVSGDRIEVCRSVRALEKKLGKLKASGSRTLAVLFSADRKDLKDLIAIQDLLEDAFVIMVLSDEKRETISLAHKIRPRFITFRSSSFADVAEVSARVLS